MDMSNLDSTHHFDVVIVGSGGAGLSLALSLPSHYKIAILAKSSLTEASTFYAQGGVAAVLDKTDSIQQHIDDTMIAGAHLCELDAVKQTVEGGRPSVNFLLKHGVEFTLDEDDQLHLTREGGHSQRRIIHAADATGKAISTTLVQRAKEASNLTIFENFIAIDIITLHKLGHIQQDNRAVGLYVLDEQNEKVHTFLAPFIALACGGAMKAYLYTSNPDIATGDGIAMAYRAGCRVANMEFNQFHPTCLYHPQARSFLITEAMRGEGAYLRLPDGERFMLRFDERAE
ncbi:FAD-binding protein, partial [Acinetobacter sp.]